MRQYKVFQHQDGRIETVKQGWSWPGFFFTTLWSLFKQMWGVTILAIISVTLCEAFLASLLGGDRLAVELVIILWAIAILVAQIVFGVYGNRWRQENLQERGFLLLQFKGTVEAANESEAVAASVHGSPTRAEQRKKDLNAIPVDVFVSRMTDLAQLKKTGIMTMAEIDQRKRAVIQTVSENGVRGSGEAFLVQASVFLEQSVLSKDDMLLLKSIVLRPCTSVSGALESPGPQQRTAELQALADAEAIRNIRKPTESVSAPPPTPALIRGERLQDLRKSLDGGIIAKE